LSKPLLWIDSKWAIEYDPENNDQPGKLFRYGCDACVDVSQEKSYVVAMFYKLLEAEKGD